MVTICQPARLCSPWCQRQPWIYYCDLLVCVSLRSSKETRLPTPDIKKPDQLIGFKGRSNKATIVCSSHARKGSVLDLSNSISCIRPKLLPTKTLCFCLRSILLHNGYKKQLFFLLIDGLYVSCPGRSCCCDVC